MSVAEIESIPQLRAERDEARRELLWRLGLGAPPQVRKSLGWSSAHRNFVVVETRLQTALWRQAVESSRWAQEPPGPHGEGWWLCQSLIAMLRWDLRRRGLCPGMELAIRPTGSMVYGRLKTVPD